MENSKNTSASPTFQRPSKYSVFKRMTNLVLVLVGIVICVNLWIINSDQSENWRNNQASQLGNSLTVLSGQMIVSAILQNDLDLMTEQLKFIAQDPHVHSAMLYNHKGQLLTGNQSSSSVVDAFKLKSPKPLVFVEDILHEKKTIGYLRLMLNEDDVMAYHSAYQLQLYQQVIVLMLLAGVVGILIARAFYKIKLKHSQKQQ